jgi:hypothetical protein
MINKYLFIKNHIRINKCYVVLINKNDLFLYLFIRMNEDYLIATK